MYNSLIIVFFQNNFLIFTNALFIEDIKIKTLPQKLPLSLTKSLNILKSVIFLGVSLKHKYFELALMLICLLLSHPIQSPLLSLLLPCQIHLSIVSILHSLPCPPSLHHSIMGGTIACTNHCLAILYIRSLQRYKSVNSVFFAKKLTYLVWMH